MVRLAFWLVAAAVSAQELVDVRRIWDQAPHNAFTDLLHHDGRWYCTFREGSSHVSPAGKIRVLMSKNGTSWESFALLEQAGDDLRDPKISVDPKGRLTLIAAAARPSGHQTLMWTLPDVRSTPIGDLDSWLWRITWLKREAFGFGYGTQKSQRGLKLYKFNGAKFETLAESFNAGTYPNESAIRFDKDGTAWCLLRRDPDNALLGQAKSPYREWSWRDLGARVGGPNFLIAPGARFIAAVRLYDGKQRTALAEIDPKNATMREMLALPSSGDSSYAGMVLDGNMLWVSYYSSHEGKTAIYLAHIRLK